MSSCGSSVASTVWTSVPSKKYLIWVGVNSQPNTWKSSLSEGVVTFLLPKVTWGVGRWRWTFTPYFNGVTESFSMTSSSIATVSVTGRLYFIIQNDVCQPPPGGTFIRAS